MKGEQCSHAIETRTTILYCGAKDADAKRLSKHNNDDDD
jgi:predicted GIY-YIG superfamily endonuclease